MHLRWTSRHRHPPPPPDAPTNVAAIFFAAEGMIVQFDCHVPINPGALVLGLKLSPGSELALLQASSSTVAATDKVVDIFLMCAIELQTASSKNH